MVILRTFNILTIMLLLICRKTGKIGGVVCLLAYLLHSTAVLAQTQLSILVTSNLQGKFSLDIDNQDNADPLLVLGQNIVYERSNNDIDMYLDLGNALYPGVLSKYSSGSIMVDFLDYFSCAAILVSSKDLQVGTQNLLFMEKNKKVHFLSTNIIQDGKPLFTSWFAADVAGTRIAFVGVSSPKVRFDVAEKDLYNYNLLDAKEALVPQLTEIRAAGIRHIVLLSGQTLQDTAQLLESYPEIRVALCGGDYTDQFLGGKASRVDLGDGRSIVMAADNVDYYRLELTLDDVLKVNAFEPRQAQPIATINHDYQEFKNRLTLWKEKFSEEEGGLVAKLSDMEYGVNDLSFGQLLRDRFNCELGIVEQNTINQVSVKEAIRRADFLSMVNRDYNIFLISLTGDEIRKVYTRSEGLVIAGIETRKDIEIQGSAVVENRRYHVAASQLAMQKIQRLLGREIDYSNTWMTVTDLLVDDMKTRKVILRSDYDYLDRRFRTTVDAYLSNFIDASSVKKGDTIDTPSGQPSGSYNKWGLENTIDLTIYNKYHRFVLTPYMFYSRQDDNYLNNILRGTFLYDYSLSETFRPYNKLRYDTVVEEVDGLHPSFLRETMGISAIYKHVHGKLGLGFEQQVQDPSEAAMYGVEFIVGARIPFLSHFTYFFDLDTFTGILDEDGGPWQTRSEINNGISARLNSYMSLSFRHKYFFFNEGVTGESYQNSQFITSLDFNSDWKFW
ncbi:hypothetical protein FCL47_13755 [Desulfopila sp. IMCC35006]|uniref:hypothetical protein n=1 Tax=Desulfopila sp. IMCC35006 TaxID=2569542 RepID=UPI0010AD16A6|nr:hypothetical protein [Desulfopila sp. IMCC35006]TKB25595.1 hypothetical protein FCL47_13755 [Desulfopila sp. IMCC35006]